MTEPLEKPQGKLLKKFNQDDKNEILIEEDLEVRIPEWIEAIKEHRRKLKDATRAENCEQKMK